MADTPRRRVRAITEPLLPTETLPTGGAMPPAVLDTEIGHRLRDPFEPLFMGIVRPNDSVLREKGGYHDWRIYRDLKRDGKVSSGMSKFIGTLLRYPYQITPLEDSARGKADADTLKRILDNTPFNRACRNLLEAELVGWSVLEVVPTWRDGLIVPAQMVQRPQRRFVYVQDDPTRPPELRMLSTVDMIRGEAIPPKQFVVHKVGDEDDNPYGLGRGHQLYWPVFFKRKSIAAWSKLVDRFGSPTPWGKYPNGATGPQRATLRDALTAFSNDGFVMTPDGNTIELIESKLTGSITTQEALCQYMDDWIAEVWCQPPSHGAGGAQAAAAVERERLLLDQVQAADELLSDTLNETLLRWLCEWNSLTPCKISRQIKPSDDRKARAEADSQVYSMGYEPQQEYIDEHYGTGWRPKQQPAPTGPQPVPGNPAPSDKPPTDGGPGLSLATKLTQLMAQRNPASFAEGRPAKLPADQVELDKAVQDLPPEMLAKAAREMLAPLMQAVEEAQSFEELLAKLETVFPGVPTAELQSTLAEAMFSAELHGVASVDAEAA